MFILSIIYPREIPANFLQKLLNSSIAYCRSFFPNASAHVKQQTTVSPIKVEMNNLVKSCSMHDESPVCMNGIFNMKFNANPVINKERTNTDRLRMIPPV